MAVRRSTLAGGLGTGKGRGPTEVMCALMTPWTTPSTLGNLTEVA
jgi:hypothetical protein